MRTVLHKLKIGDLVRAQVVEILNSGEYIVSFQGDLIRVKNESRKPLFLDDRVLVRVVTVSPLAFQLIENEKSARATRINISI